jgi:hypothetical protein
MRLFVLYGSFDRFRRTLDLVGVQASHNLLQPGSCQWQVGL